MRISIDISSLLKERSGVGQYVYHLINGLGTIDAKNRYDLFYSSLRRSIRCVPSFYFSNISCRRIWCSSQLMKLSTGLGRWKLPGFDQLFGPADLFHWPNYLLIPGGSSRHIITICDLTFLIFPSYHPVRRVRAFTAGISRSAHRADAIIAISRHTKQDVVKYLGVPEEKIYVIHCAASSRFRPIPPNQADPILSAYSLQRKKYLLFVGNIEPRKNLTRLLDAYGRLRMKGGCTYPLVLIGGKGWRNADIYKTVEELSLEKDVRFFGYVPDEELPALMSGAALFVYPSLYEGFGLPPLEAMACGTPVVVSNSSSFPEVVGDAALMVDPYDAGGLAEAMHDVLTRKGLREELGEKGPQRARRFSWQEAARRTLKVYEDVYAQPKSL